MEYGSGMLAPPAVTLLRAQAGGTMERSLSADIRKEREDLREAAEQTLNVILDLNLDGSIRWVSPSWKDVIGTAVESVQGKPIQDILVGDNKNVFAEVVELMKKDDSRSQIIRFTVKLGPTSKLAPIDVPEELKESGGETHEPTIDLEGQGIMVYDRSSEGESHVRWNSIVVLMKLMITDNVDAPALDRSP
jgi:serine/threonine-protein kinase RIM15